MFFGGQTPIAGMMSSSWSSCPFRSLLASAATRVNGLLAEPVAWQIALFPAPGAAPFDQDAPERVDIDAPFGWPRDFVAAVAAYAASGEWTTDEIAQGQRMQRQRR